MKAVMAVAVVVVAVSAIVASAASATEPYFVAVKGTLPMKGTATIGESHLVFPNVDVEIVCKKGSENGELLNRSVSGQNIGGLQKGTVTLEGCTFEASGGECGINGKSSGEGIITLTGVAAELGYAPGSANKENVRFHFTSENAESVFTTVTLTGSNCSLKNEKYKVKKGLIGAIPSMDVETPLAEVSLAVKTVTGHQELTEIENPLVGAKVIEEKLSPWGILGSLGFQSPGLLKLTEGNEVEIKL